MQQQGYIKLLRSFTDWSWFTDVNVAHLFCYLLINVASKEVTVNGITIGRGSIITGRRELSRETGLSEQNIRSCLRKLVGAGEIHTETTRSHTLITILHLERYVQVQPLNNQQDNQQVTKNQEETKEENKKEEIPPITPKEEINKEERKEEGKEKEVMLSYDNIPIQKSVAKKKSPGDVSLVTKCRQKFEEFFLRRYQEPYYWTGEDARATKILLNKLKRSRNLHTPPKPTDDGSMVAAFEQFIKMISNDWLFDNFDMKTINGQYNKIIARYKNPYRYTGDNYTSLKDPKLVEHSGDTAENYFHRDDINDDPTWDPYENTNL